MEYLIRHLEALQDTSLAEREELLPTCQLILQLSRKSNTMGFLSLDPVLEAMEDSPFKAYLWLAVDGYPTEEIVETHHARLVTWKRTPKDQWIELLSGLGALRIHAGTNTTLLAQILSAYLGMPRERLEALEEVTEKHPLDFLHKWPSRGIQKLLREIDTRTLAEALIHADIHLNFLFWKNMSERTQMILQEEILYLRKDPGSSEQPAIAEIKRVADLLVEQGEIAEEDYRV